MNFGNLLQIDKICDNHNSINYFFLKKKNWFTLNESMTYSFRAVQNVAEYLQKKKFDGNLLCYII